MNNSKDEHYDWENEILNCVLKRKKMLEDLIESKTVSLKKAPAGSLKAVDKKTHFQYFQRTDPKDANGVYITKDNISLARQLAQKEYDRNVLQEVQKELVLISKYASYLSTGSLFRIFENLNPAKKVLIEPVYVDDDQFRQEWRTEKYTPLQFSESSGEFYTKNGVRVRSKSELIIASMLEQYDIPYRYEFPLVLKDRKNVHPDFLCLNVKKRKEYIWEHFGMMDNISYACNNINKITAYELSGYYAGENMIVTFETSQTAISSNIIKEKIKHYLL